jgi:hypothetical protein
MTNANATTCPHASIVEIDDRTSVCIRCERVIPAGADRKSRLAAIRDAEGTSPADRALCNAALAYVGGKRIQDAADQLLAERGRA